MSLKTQIIELRKQNKSYDQIAQILNCSKSSVSYHLSPEIRERYHKRQRRNRKLFMTQLKQSHGGKCQICKYDKCLEVLDFHHINPSLKFDNIGYMAENYSHEKVQEEAKKCILLCSNCHREVHLGITKIEVPQS
jgi:predicted HNH restriction endonuclease